MPAPVASFLKAEYLSDSCGIATSACPKLSSGATLTEEIAKLGCFSRSAGFGLHYASDDGLTVMAYEDQPVGIGEIGASGAGRFTSAFLRPHILLSHDDDVEVATAIHHRTHAVCFIAGSVNFPVSYGATFASA